ncbi:MAG: QueT transporter family protein [Eubacteriales bacterium]|nr:QueT transporter family protein [Eubacteriales bacterium]
MNRDGKKLRVLTIGAVTGALYAVLTLIAAPISYGPMQVRISEALCVLPFLLPQTAWGLFAGCFLANLMTGNIFDIVFGSLATLAAGLITGLIGKRSRSAAALICGCLSPVIINALVIGTLITRAYEGLEIVGNFGVFAVNVLWLAVGEAAAVFLLGLPLLRILIKKDVFQIKNT